MNITIDALVSEIAAAEPATIKVFQRHRIEFCCGGRTPLSEVCARQDIDTVTLLAELRAAQESTEDQSDWPTAPLADLIGHIQGRYHGPLREELPRLSAMLAKVVSKHGHRNPAIAELQRTFEALRQELIDHMAHEDRTLFPAMLSVEAGDARLSADTNPDTLDQFEAEHQAAGAALATMRALTSGYAPPDDACPTFRGLYFGLAQLERDMQRHVHLENHVLFPRAMRLSADRERTAV